MGETYESKREDNESAQRMCEHAESKYPDILEGNHQIPEEVSSSHALNHARSTSVAPDALLPIHTLSLLVVEHYPQGEDVDGRALDQGHHMDVPVDLPFWR